MTFFGILVAATLALYLLGFTAFAGNGDGGKTATAGTAIQYLIPPDKRGVTRITTINYTTAGTAHTLTLLRPLGRTLCSATGAAGQAVINLVADPGSAAVIYGGVANAIATNDFVAIRETDGNTRVYKVLTVAGLVITLGTNLVAGVNSSCDVWFFGLPADTDGRSGNPHPALAPPVSVTTTFTDRDGGVVATYGRDEPILFNSTNAAAAGTLALLSWAYSIS